MIAVLVDYSTNKTETMMHNIHFDFMTLYRQYTQYLFIQINALLNAMRTTTQKTWSILYRISIYIFNDLFH